MAQFSPGARLRQALAEEKPLQMVGAINAYAALLAEQAGFRALYLSGAGVANASFGLPDLAMTTATELAAEVRRITGASSLPLLVDADTGFGPALSIARTVKELTRAGAAGLHLEDQVQAKRCGHRPGKELVSAAEMQDRVAAACHARPDPDFVIVARTDAYAVEGLAAAIARAQSYVEAGADWIFAEALGSLSDYQAFVKQVPVPILANLTEFGKTPLLPTEALAEVGVGVALYPLSAFRAMAKAAQKVYQEIRTQGTQAGLVDEMQTRSELYQTIGYYDYERQIDELLKKESKWQTKAQD